MAVNAVTLELVSGFSIDVAPMSPYYLDFLDLVYPYREYPKREIVLAAGDTYEIDFKPSEDEQYAPNHPDYELFIKYKATDSYNADLAKIRTKARNDYLLSTCIKRIDGPYDWHDENWRASVEAAFVDRGWRLSKHEGAVRLLFIKSIITTQAERDNVLKAALLSEVSEQELSLALDMFQSVIQ